MNRSSLTIVSPGTNEMRGIIMSRSPAGYRARILNNIDVCNALLFNVKAALNTSTHHAFTFSVVNMQKKVS